MNIRYTPNGLDTSARKLHGAAPDYFGGFQPMLNRKNLRGLWRRNLLVRPGEMPDRLTQVYWLQSRRYFVDLRQPPARPDFACVHSLSDLTPHQIEWMARQEGFAGMLRRIDGDIAEWDREIDFQPSSGIRDRGRLILNGDSLEERGTETEYLEEWQRESLALTPMVGVKLSDGAGRIAYLVRVAQIFQYARPRLAKLPVGGTLAQLVAGASRDEALALLDFEISVGRVEGGIWRIAHSSLPFKEGEEFRIRVSGTELAMGEGAAPWQIVGTDDAAFEKGGEQGSDLAQVVHCLSED